MYTEHIKYILACLQASKRALICCCFKRLRGLPLVGWEANVGDCRVLERWCRKEKAQGSSFWSQQSSLPLDPHQCSRLGRVLSAASKGLSKPHLPLAGTGLPAQPQHIVSQTTQFSSTSSDHLVAGTLPKVGLWAENLGKDAQLPPHPIGKRGQTAQASSFFSYRQNSHTWDFKESRLKRRSSTGS